MYNTLERMYNIAYYGFQCLGVALIFLYLSSTILYVPPVTSIKHNATVSLKTFRKIDVTDFTIDLDVDFTPSFNWNTKMIFVWVKASFETEKVPSNTATIWDTMIRTKERAHLKLLNEKIEYPLMDFGKSLKGKEIELTVEWMVIPWTGATSIERGNTTKFYVPADYTK